jgi:hypothetical protein
MRARSPSAYGTFGVFHDGELLSYRDFTKKQFDKKMQTR